MTAQTSPYEILLRFRDGALAGAHYVETTRYMDGETLLTEKQGLPQEIPTELSESLLGSINAGLLARIAELESELAAAKEQPAPTTDPTTIRSWQAKAVLAISGLLEAAEATIAALPEPDRTIVTSAWDNNANFSRQSPTILALAADLKLTEEQLDAMFQQAAALTI